MPATARGDTYVWITGCSNVLRSLGSGESQFLTHCMSCFVILAVRGKMKWAAANLILVKNSIADPGHEHHRDQEWDKGIVCHFQYLAE